MNYKRLSPIDFENLCQLLMNKMGFFAETTKQTGDGGIDIIAYYDHPFLSGKYIVQCKHYESNVGVAAVRELHSVVISEKANKGILITSSSFTKGAFEEAKQKNIELIDGTYLDNLLDKYEITTELSSSVCHFSRHPSFAQSRYEYYRSVISDSQCSEEMANEFVLEFMFNYLNCTANGEKSVCQEIIHNGLAEEYLRLFDWLEKKYYKKDPPSFRI